MYWSESFREESLWQGGRKWHLWPHVIGYYKPLYHPTNRSFDHCSNRRQRDTLQRKNCWSTDPPIQSKIRRLWINCCTRQQWPAQTIHQAIGWTCRTAPSPNTTKDWKQWSKCEIALEPHVNGLACTDRPWWAAQSLQRSSCLHQTTLLLVKEPMNFMANPEKLWSHVWTANDGRSPMSPLSHFDTFCDYLYTWYSEINSNVKD